MNLVTEVTLSRGMVGRIYYDESPGNPRQEFDHVGSMVCFHGRYELGDKDHGLPLAQFASWSEVRAEIKKLGASVILPIYMYDHSGITISTTPFSCPWDSGQIGFIYVTDEKLKAEMGWKRLSANRINRASRLLKSEVEEYDQYLRGEVYGFTLGGSDGEKIDSCWGIYGLELAMSHMKEAARAAADALPPLLPGFNEEGDEYGI